MIVIEAISYTTGQVKTFEFDDENDFKRIWTEYPAWNFRMNTKKNKK